MAPDYLVIKKKKKIKKNMVLVGGFVILWGILARKAELLETG